jgi:hypothetical protein
MHPAFSRVRLNWVSALGILCIGLVLVSGMAQATHFHASGTVDHDCALCVSAHSAAHVAPAVTLDLTGLQVAAVAPARRLHMPRRAVFFRLISRPPPSGSALLA